MLIIVLLLRRKAEDQIQNLECLLLRFHSRFAHPQKKDLSRLQNMPFHVKSLIRNVVRKGLLVSDRYLGKYSFIDLPFHRDRIMNQLV